MGRWSSARRSTTLLSALLFACEPSASSPLEPNPPPNEMDSTAPCSAAASPILFESTRASLELARELYSMRIDGSDVSRIAQAGSFSEAVWSPDGRSIAFRREAAEPGNVVDPSSEIDLMDADGSGRLALFEDEDATLENAAYARLDGPTWSPDGASIAYATHASGQWAVWLMSRSGGEQRRLLPELEAAHDDPSFAPLPPSRLAYVATVDGVQDVWLVELEQPDASRNLTGGTLFQPRSPSWSRDGRNIAFSAHPTALDAAEEVYVFELDGAELVQVTSDGAMAIRPHFSPDGQSLIFASSRGDADPAAVGPSIDVYRSWLDGSQPIQRLTRGPGANFPADWYPGATCEAEP